MEAIQVFNVPHTAEQKGFLLRFGVCFTAFIQTEPNPQQFQDFANNGVSFLTEKEI